MRESGSARRSRAFPSTSWSCIRNAGTGDPDVRRASLDQLFRIYWRPVYSYLRHKWTKSHEDAKDFTQEFFAALLEKDVFARLSAEQGRFRSYVMTALDNFVVTRHRYQGRIKRGGGREVFSIDAKDSLEPSGGGTPEEVFLREWARAALADALHELARENPRMYAILRLRDVDAPPDEDLSYRGLAKRFGLRESDVTNLLYRGRQRLRELLLARVRDTVVSEREAEAEMRLLFGARRR